MKNSHTTKTLEKHVKEHTIELKKSLSLIRATLESSNDGILVVNSDGKLVDFNNRFLLLWHMKKNNLENNNFDYLTKQISENIKDKEKFLKRINELNRNPESVIIDIIKLKNGKIFEFYSQPQKLLNKTIGRVWSFRDITERALLEEKLQHQATHDTLTDLPNRISLYQYIQEAIQDYQDNQMQFAVMFIDLNRFKLINDSLSHAAGDEVLCNVAKRLQATVRSSDMLARIGGDEFVLVIKNIKHSSTLAEIAQNISNIIDLPFYISDREIMISASVGISLYPKDGNSVDDLLRTADTAMYHAKKNGTNQCQFYTERMCQESLKQLELETQLRQAIANKEFFLCYQPQFDISTEKLVAIEALIRWKHPQKGIISPLDFIPLAEATGLIIPIGEWALRTACKQNKTWQDAGFPPIRVAVNITTHQLHQYNLVKSITDILHETKLNPEYLELELTENSIVNNASVIDTITALKTIGIRIALDDFGTGYSSLNFLRSLPIDRLKIDKSFVQNIKINHGDEAIIQAIIALAQSLNLEVLAEGVENQHQLAYLQSQKCGEIQGFYFSKPLSVEELEKMLANKSSIHHLLKAVKE
jgi:diguanylate cyclase (GGDEF)-like protein/PAS domain S-box-containing protein